jgi:hypothetical protein
MKKFIPEMLAVLALVAAVLVLVVQRIVTDCDRWFKFEDIHNYETLASFFVVGGVALVIGKYLGKYFG